MCQPPCARSQLVKGKVVLAGEAGTGGWGVWKGGVLSWGKVGRGWE